MNVNPNRDLEQVLYLLADWITSGVCRATTKRDERAQVFLDVRGTLLRLVEQTAELGRHDPERAGAVGREADCELERSKLRRAIAAFLDEWDEMRIGPEWKTIRGLRQTMQETQ